MGKVVGFQNWPPSAPGLTPKLAYVIFCDCFLDYCIVIAVIAKLEVTCDLVDDTSLYVALVAPGSMSNSASMSEHADQQSSQGGSP